MNIAKPPQEQLDNLLKYYQNGKYADAEKLSLNITQEFPDHQFAWRVLAVVLQQTGKIKESLNASQKFVQLEPMDSNAHNCLGNAMKEFGKLKEAEKSYKKAIELKPDIAEIHYNLGNTAQDLKKLEEAEKSYKKAIELKPSFAEAFNNLGNTLVDLNKLEESETNYKQAIELKPDFIQAYNNLGNVLLDLKKLEEAELIFRKSLSLNPKFAESHNGLGNILKDLGRFEEAEISFKKAISLKPDLAEPYFNLGNIAKDFNKQEKAESLFRKAIELKPGYPDAYNNLGATLKRLGKLKESELIYRKLLSLNPEFALGYNNLGNTLLEFGNLEEAKSNFRKAIELKSDLAETHRHLSLVKKFDSKDEQYLKMKELSLNKNISEDQLCHINFGLAKASEDLKDYEQAYLFYRQGNQLRKNLLNHNFNHDTNLYNQLKSHHLQIKQNSLETKSLNNKLLPIFIVGMPRSGTTLVEQIISSHSLVSGAGELSFIGNFGRDLAKGLTDINLEAILEFRKKYLSKLQNFSNGNLIVTDKMPNNYHYIGLIIAAFPEAKIVHVKRNPAAVCWSIYKNYFASNDLDYCHQLDDIIKYYELYKDLMKFWKKEFSKKIYDIDYELLTVNQEGETRKLINYIGLNWEDKCLQPQNNTRNINTASSAQVREKVYQGSSQKWKKFKPYLNGKLDRLDC